MKKEAESRGAELAPISETLGMSSGRGVVSMRTCWLNLENLSAGRCDITLYDTHLGCLADILCDVVLECGQSVMRAVPV